jgi:hypothetical protein
MSGPAHSSQGIVANMQLPGRLRELASGVDALYLSARPDLPSQFIEHLEYCREWAGEAKRPAPCQIGDAVFGISPFGWGKYRYCLDHQMARLGFTTSRHLPTVRIQPRAQYLHAIGPAAVVASLQETLGPDLGKLYFGVSRVDLFADWQGWSLSLDDAHRFVCRADARRTYELGGTLTGFEFGSRKTKTFSARLYDKTAEIAVKANGWWLEIWGDRFVPEVPVHRMEFEIGREGLVEFDLETPTQVLAAAGDLWAYATEHWLTYRSPTSDQTRSRWPIADEWRQVQKATLSHHPVGIERLRSTHRSTSITKLLPGLTGYLASLGALIDAEGIDDTVGAVGHHLHNYEIISRTPFAERIERRRQEQELR